MKLNTATADEFIATADARETDVEIMAAIWSVAETPEDAEDIWENGPGERELIAILERVTCNGINHPCEFCWGAAGSDWADLAANPCRA